MEKKYMAILLTLWIGLLSFVGINKAQGNLFDIKKTREEVEIMKGILESTLKIAFRGAQPGGEETPFWGGPSPHISGGYLYGQGAVFTLSAPSSFLAAMPKLAMLAPMPPKPPTVSPVPKISGRSADKAPSAPSAPEAPHDPLVVGPDGDSDLIDVDQVTKQAMADAEKAMKQVGKTMKQQELFQNKWKEKYEKDLRTSLAAAQKSLQEWRSQVQVQKQDVEKQVALMKPALIEALAKHGDSLTIVKPEEYISLILASERWGGFFTEEGEDGREVISVKKSVITDYKAGRITLDEFKKKVLVYVQ